MQRHPHCALAKQKVTIQKQHIGTSTSEKNLTTFSQCWIRFFSSALPKKIFPQFLVIRNVL
jgi:hypothetical protein